MLCFFYILRDSNVKRKNAVKIEEKNLICEMDQEQKRKRSGPLWTLNLLSSAAIATATIMYPLDVLRALNMANESLSGFVKSHGIRGMFKQGVAAEIGRASMMRVSKFFFFPRICNTFYGKDVKQCNPVEKAFAGIFSAVPEILVISPFEVAKVGLQLDETNKYRNSISAFIRDRVSKSGVSSIYHGWAGMQYRYVVTPFLLIENTRTHTHTRKQPMQLDRGVLFNSIILQRAFWKPYGWIHGRYEWCDLQLSG